MKVMCIKDLIYAGANGLADKIYFSKGEVYNIDSSYTHCVSVLVKWRECYLDPLNLLLNDPPISVMFYYSSKYTKYMGLMYEDYFVSIEDYRDNILGELGI